MQNCVRSLESGGAEGLDWELLIGDNASGDCDRLEELRTHSHIRLFPGKENLGFGRENNRLALEASGEFLLCLNPDTIVPPGTLRALVDHLRTHPKCGACGPRLMNADGSRQFSWNCRMGLLWEFAEAHYLQNIWRRFWERRLQRQAPGGPWDVDFTSGACLCLRAPLFRKLSGYDPEFFLNSEDIELCHRIRREGLNIHVLPRLSIRHLDGGSQHQDWSRFIRDRLAAKRIWLRRRFSGIALLTARFLWWEGTFLRTFLAPLLFRGTAQRRRNGYLAAMKDALHD